MQQAPAPSLHNHKSPNYPQLAVTTSCSANFQKGLGVVFFLFFFCDLLKNKKKRRQLVYLRSDLFVASSLLGPYLTLSLSIFSSLAFKAIDPPFLSLCPLLCPIYQVYTQQDLANDLQMVYFNCGLYLLQAPSWCLCTVYEASILPEVTIRRNRYIL